MKLGVIQGRLTPPDEGFQECPRDWQREFYELEKISLNHIEWIVTKDSFSTNPAFFQDISKYPIHTICADNVVSELICNKMFLQHNLLPICESAVKNNIRYVTMPLLEASSLESDSKVRSFIRAFSGIALMYPDLGFSLETELSLDRVEELLSIGENIFLTYDTGNTTSYGISHDEYITRFHDKITNVHIKDRTFGGISVRPPKGDTDFEEIFCKLKSKQYTGCFTLQTVREISGEEANTVRTHSKIIGDIYERC